ncbi:uncharacterized protein FYW23_005870 isoform 2-T7 [Sylvia borin]
MSITHGLKEAGDKRLPVSCYGARYHQGPAMSNAETDQSNSLFPTLPQTCSVGRSAAVSTVSLQRQLSQWRAVAQHSLLGGDGGRPGSGLPSATGRGCARRRLTRPRNSRAPRSPKEQGRPPMEHPESYKHDFPQRNEGNNFHA